MLIKKRAMMMMNTYERDSLMNLWLNAMADYAQVPDLYRQKYINGLRQTMLFAFVQLRLSLCWSYESGCKRLIEHLERSTGEPPTIIE